MLSQLQCPDRELLHDLLNGELSERQQQELTAHLDNCPNCQRALENLAGGGRPLPGTLRPALESALRQAMDQLKGHTQPAVEREAAPDLPDPPEFLDGFGAYRVAEVVGRGGMGIVLKAFDPELNRFVAIKMLAPQLATSAGARRRFAREARAAAAISHEHVVAIHAVAHNGRSPYLVMQYVPGISLQERLDRTGPLELLEILRIGQQAACGLAAAHAQGLIHRDVKPANILLENGIERVKLTDFGLARAADDASLTQSGFLAGTPLYMAPEQARGEAVDHRSDLFSLGSVLYALCTGRPPFRASTTLAVLRRVSEDAPRPVRELNPAVPEWLARLIEKLHAKDPNDRFQSAAEVADLLGRCLAHVQAPETVPLPAIPGEPPARKARSRRWPWVAAGLLFLAGLLAVTEATGFTRILDFALVTLRLRTAEGTLVIEVDDPDVKVTVDGDDVLITGGGVQELRLRPGSYKVQASKPGTKPFEEIVSLSRGGKQVVKVSLEPLPQDKGKKETLPRAETPFQDHKGPVTSLVFSPDGKLLISGGADRTTVVRDTDSGKIVLVLKEDLGRIVTVAVSADRRSLLTVQDDGTVTVWDLASGKRLAIFKTNTQLGLGVFSPDLRRLATGTADRIRLWDVGTGKEIAEMNQDAQVLSVAFSPDGKLLASGSVTPVLRLWDAASGKLLREVNSPDKRIQGLAFSPDGKVLATAGGDIVLRMWEMGSAKELHALTIKGGDAGPVRALVFSPDGRLLASGWNDGWVRLWDPVRDKATEFDARAPITSLAFSPDGRRLAVGTADGTVKIWELPEDGTSERELNQLREQLKVERLRAQEAEEKARAQAEEARRQADLAQQREQQARQAEEKARHEAEVQKLQAERALYAAEIERAYQAWEANEEGKAARMLDQCRFDLRGWEWHYLMHRAQSPPVVLTGHSAALFGLVFSPNGKQLGSAAGDNVRLWDPTTGKEGGFFVSEGPAHAVAFSPDGKLLATADAGVAVRLWTGPGKVKAKLTGHTNTVLTVAFSPDGKLLASGGKDGTVRLWDTVEGKELRVLAANASVTQVVFSPDGKRCAAALDGAVRIWDVATGQETAVIEARKTTIRALAFNPDGTRLATAGDREVIVWYPDSGKEVYRLKGHTNDVTGVAWSPDGLRLVSCSLDKTVRIWDPAVAQQILVLDKVPAGLTCVAFSPNGQILAAGSEDHTIRVWGMAKK